MSLFGNDQYQWRETYFVLFRRDHRPTADRVTQLLKRDDQIEILEVRATEDGLFDSLTLKCPDDFSAMDITFITGEEVTEQVAELMRILVKATLTDEERQKLDELVECNARFDIFHFEEVQANDQDDVLDPGALLLVMEHLAELCEGVAIDPQSGSLI